MNRKTFIKTIVLSTLIPLVSNAQSTFAEQRVPYQSDLSKEEKEVITSIKKDLTSIINSYYLSKYDLKFLTSINDDLRNKLLHEYVIKHKIKSFTSDISFVKNDNFKLTGQIFIYWDDAYRGRNKKIGFLIDYFPKVQYDQ